MTSLHDCGDPNSTTNSTILLHSRRSIMTALASAALVSASPVVAVADTSSDDERFMRIALDEAQHGDYPFGAVIVRDGEVLARGRNLGKTNGDPTAHGEMMAIRHCLTAHGRDALKGRAGGTRSPLLPVPGQVF